MEVNGLPLPAELVQIVSDGQGEWTEWMTKEHVMKARMDAYGHPFDCASIEVFNLETMAEETAELPQRFDPYDELEPLGNIKAPGFIPDIKDFSKIVVFAKTGSGEPFCLDYRDSRQKPSIVFWRSGYWRRLAPSFAAFMELFDPFEYSEFTRRMDEVYE